MKNILIISFVTILVCVSCNRLSKKDLSLTSEEYLKLGMPDQNKIWNNDDYIAANITLSSLKLNNPFSFPKKQSKKSGALFSRIINTGNLTFADDTALSLRYRALLIQHFPRFQGELCNLYTIKFKNKLYYSEELVDLYIFGLSIHGKMLELAGKIMISKEESDRSIQSGLNSVLFNYLKTINTLLEEQVKSKFYRLKDLDNLSDEVSRSLRENLEWINPIERQKIKTQLQSVIEKSPTKYIRNNYINTSKILND